MATTEHQGLEEDPALVPAVARVNNFPGIPTEWQAHDHVKPGSLILFGSSIMARWKDCAEDWDPLAVYNRGFGGSRTWECVEYLHLILSYKPRVVIFYCGTNDVTFHSEQGTPEDEALAEILENITIILRTTEATGVQMILGSLIKSPQKRENPYKLRLVERANLQLHKMCEDYPHAEFVDINPLVEDEHGHPVSSLYEDDGLHYRRAGYLRISQALKEPVMRRWQRATRRPTVRHFRNQSTKVKAKL